MADLPQPKGTGFWRTLAFVTMYGLSAVAVTVVFFRSNQPSADTVPLTTTTNASSAATATAATGSTSGLNGPADATSATTTVPAALTQSANFTANDSYGISGSASFVNASTVLVKAFSFSGTGPKAQLELRDSSDQTLAVMKDLTNATPKGEDLVLAVPTTVDVSQVSSLAVVAPDFKLVLSRASWK